jgi:(p)ppGpp synthase/HD superfamily hydrolase
MEIVMPLGARFEEGLLLAARLHAAQVRKLSGVPYVGHLLGACATVLTHGGDEDQALAALLHDAVEDQGGQATREEIARRFGEPVAQIVDGCTDATQTPKPPWRQRKEAHLARLANASAAVCLVEAADKLDNVRALAREYRRHGPAMWGHFRGGRDGTLWYYRAMLDVLRRAAPADLVAELEQALRELEQLVAGGPT